MSDCICHPLHRCGRCNDLGVSENGSASIPTRVESATPSGEIPSQTSLDALPAASQEAGAFRGGGETRSAQTAVVTPKQTRPDTKGASAGASPAPHTTGNGSLKRRPAALVITPAMADALQTASVAPTNDKPRCPQCKSPDLVPYKFGDIHDDVAAEYRARFPRARLCVDCEHCEWEPEL